jgi:hypothetical protein
MIKRTNDGMRNGHARRSKAMRRFNQFLTKRAREATE